MVPSSVNNVREFDRTAKALVLQYPRVHLTETKKCILGKGEGRRVKPRRPKATALVAPMPLARATTKFQAHNAWEGEDYEPSDLTLEAVLADVFGREPYAEPAQYATEGEECEYVVYKGNDQLWEAEGSSVADSSASSGASSDEWLRAYVSNEWNKQAYRKSLGWIA